MSLIAGSSTKPAPSSSAASRQSAWVGDARRRHLLSLTLIVLVALGFRVWGLTWGLHNAGVSRRPQPDEWVVYWLFQWFDRNHNLNPCPTPAGQCFFDWGSVYPYLAYGVHGMVSPMLGLLPRGFFGPHADPAFILSTVSGRVTSILASTITVVVAYRYAAVAYGAAAGLLAALLVALSGLLIQLAHFATPDSTTILFMSSSLLAMLLAVRDPAAWRFALAGLLGGLAMGVEYHMVLLALPLLAAWYLSECKKVGWLLTGYGAAAGAYLVSNAYALIELGAFLSAMEHTIRIRTVDSHLQYQGRFAAYGPSWLYVVRYPLGYGVGAAFSLWMVVGAIWGAIRHRKADLLLLSWLVPYFLLVTFSSAKFMRYSAPLLPPLAILGAGFAVDVLRSRQAIRRLVLAGAALALAFTTVYDAAYAGLFSSPEPRATAAAWLARHAVPGARLEFEAWPNGLLNMAYFTERNYQPCFAQFQARALYGPMRYVVLDNYSLEEHPLIARHTVLAFRRALATSPRYRVVMRTHYVPTFLGLRFPIDGSPHDWRYPDHVITIYQQIAGRTPNSRYCYPNMAAAKRALYVPPIQ